ncbi:MAG: cytochrome c biogenesis protein [Deferrisomatales bacterium]
MEALYPWGLRLAAAAAAGWAFTLAWRGGWPRGCLAVPVGAALAAGMWRTAQTGRPPLTGLHETTLLLGILLVVTAALFCVRGGHGRAYGLCLLGAATLWAVSSATNPRPAPDLPALQTWWFEIHVATSFASYACFAVGAAAGLVHLAGGERPGNRGVLEAANRWGFAWFTWGMVSGGIWAYLAWGTYWLWHVKELWSAIVWTYYAGLIHLPHMAGWRGRRQSWASVVGLGLVLFTYLGVGLLMRNTHQF